LQTINQLVDFINEQITATTAGPTAATAPVSDEEEEEEEEGEAAAARQRRAQQAAAAAAAETEKPSELLKLLRGNPTAKPLFLAAPGVANAQSAYFAFSQFLAWSDQPIYVLEKDNDLNIYDLARQNARDILKVRTAPAYLAAAAGPDEASFCRTVKIVACTCALVLYAKHAALKSTLLVSVLVCCCRSRQRVRTCLVATATVGWWQWRLLLCLRAGAMTWAWCSSWTRHALSRCGDTHKLTSILQLSNEMFRALRPHTSLLLAQYQRNATLPECVH
jgi:hypothetical protein